MLVDKLTHENAVLKRLKFAAQSERFAGEQRSLLEETLDADLQAVSEEIEKLHAQDTPAAERRSPKRQPLPADLPRREIHHEPENTTCSCGCQMKRIGEDVAEKLDYEPGVFTVERHVRKWVCSKCEKLVQAPVAPHVGAAPCCSTSTGTRGVSCPRQGREHDHWRLVSVQHPLCQQLGFIASDKGLPTTGLRNGWAVAACNCGLWSDHDLAESRAGRHPAEFLGHPGERA